MSGRFLRTTLSLALVWATALAPVAPAFGQTQDQTPPPATSQPQPQAQTPAEPPAAPAPQIPARTIPMSSPDYTHGNRAFPNVLGPYSSPKSRSQI